MKPWETAREYGERTVLAADDKGRATYVEYEYKEYRADGRILTGTEDFSIERLRSVNMDWYWIWTPTGQLDKGGHRKWKCLGCIYCKNAKKARMIATIKHGLDMELQIRR